MAEITTELAMLVVGGFGAKNEGDCARSRKDGKKAETNGQTSLNNQWH